MPLMIILPIALRIAAALVFVVAIIIAGAANRSLLIVPMVAVTATVTGLVQAKHAILPQGQTADNVSLLTRAGRKFVPRLIGYGVLFGLSVLTAAMFRETQLATQTTLFDALLIFIPFVASYIFTEISARTGLGQAANLMKDAQAAFHQTNENSAEEPFTIDGTVNPPPDGPANDA